MPQKTWLVGEEVLAADWNTHVQQQVVAQFPNAAARTTQWPTPPEGALSYLADVNRYETWDGTAWLYLIGANITARISAGASITVPGAPTALLIPWAVTDIAGPPGMAVTGAAAGLVAPVTGVYLVTTNVVWSYNGGAVLSRLEMAGMSGNVAGMWSATGTVGTGLSWTGIGTLTAGTKVQTTIAQGSGNAVGMRADSHLAMTRIS